MEDIEAGGSTDLVKLGPWELNIPSISITFAVEQSN